MTPFHKVKYFLFNQKQRIYIYQLLGQFSSQGLGFLLGVVLVRISGVEVSGAYSALLAIINMTIGVVGGGIITNYLRNGDVTDYPLALYSVISASLLAYMVLLPIYIFMGYALLEVTLVYIVSLFMLFIHLNIYSLRLRKMDKKVLLPNLLPISLVILGLLIFKPQTLGHFLYISVVSWAISLFFVGRDLSQSPRFNWSFQDVWKYAYMSKVLIITIILTQINGNIDVVLLKKIQSDELAGLYKIAMSLTLFVLPIIGIFNFIYLSEIRSYINKKNTQGLNGRRRQQFLLIGSISGAFVLFCLLFNEMLVAWLYKIHSHNVWVVSVILSISVAFNGLGMINSYTLMGLGLEKKIFVPLLCVTLFNVLINILLIQYCDIIGAAIANTTTQVLMFLITTLLLRTKIKTITNN